MIVFTTVTTVTDVTTVKQQKKVYLLSTFGKSNFTHLTTDVMFAGQDLAILVMF